MAGKFKVLLYYKYVKLEQLEKIQLEQKALCLRLNLKGRVLLSDEGINGTIAGFPSDVDTYIKETGSMSFFSGMEWKISFSEEQVFPKMKVVVRDEIVTLGLKKNGDDVLISKKADYIEPEELNEYFEKGRDFIIVDARNSYESSVGKFKGAKVGNIDNFRDFPKFVEELKEHKDKEIVTYCTGGVRCEKASAYLKEQGFKNVRQLHGGIHEYGEKVGGKYFEGQMFVFDKRLTIPVNKINPSLISECIYCKVKISRYVDCAILSCHSLFICCEDCQAKNKGTCSFDCLTKLEAKLEPFSSVFANISL